MVFSSVVFLFVFLPVVLAIYFILVSVKAPRNLTNAWLFFMSLIFYAWGEPIYVFLMIGSTIVAYVAGLFIGKYKELGDIKKARLSLGIAIFIHVGALVIFKYTDFILANINSVFKTSIKLPELALPIGISFYTFQILSYLIDAYWGKVAVQKNWLKLATYVALFPQLIAGPIVRYETVENELSLRVESVDLFAEGAKRFVIGLGKKVLIANTVGELYTRVHALNADNQSVVLLWLASIAFTFQIYYDFSGYSDMAIGLGKMFGFNFLENFNYPYISDSITEFWRRWHISLSSWFKDYIYIPLGGNRVGAFKQYRNIFIVWLLTGIWHGAAWTFVTWGLYFCVLLIIEKVFLLNLLKKLPKFVRMVYAMFLVVISWTVFAANDMAEFFVTLKGMFGFGDIAFFNGRTAEAIGSYLLLFIIAAIGATPLPKKLYDKYIVSVEDKNVIFKIVQICFITLVFVISIAYLVSASFNPFLYFRF
ncbi:MAG: MBOAT family protein [Lachnospiraceae bacterium]|nr:MBOAT family protein [Lachnospiraceae bacterium]